VTWWSKPRLLLRSN
jgi:hypothetical protein